MGVQANDMEAQLSSNARDLLRQVHKACYPKVAPEALELFFLNNGIDDIEDLAAMLDEVSLMECGIPRAASRVAIRRITDQILKPEVVEPSCEESPRQIEVKNSIEDQVSRFLGETANSSRLNSETKVEAEEVTVSPKSLTKRRMSVDLKASLEIAEAANAAEACCVDAAQAAEQAAEFVRQAEAEARSQPRDSSAAAMSDVEAMLAKRGAAAGSEAIHAKRVTAAVVTLPSPVLTPRVAPERTRIVINAEDVFDAHINKLMLRSRKKFDHFDYDGNGLLEGAELVDLGEWLWSSFHPSEAASEKKKEAEGLKLLFRQDENGDGALSFEEFEGWFRKTCVAIEKYRRGLSNKPNLKMKPPVRKKMPKRERIAIQADEIFDAHINKLMLRARKKFDQFDVDGNGLLEGDELVNIGEWLWSSFHPGDEASEKKKEAEGLKLLFRQDENGDGALSFDEFEGWFRKTCAAIEKYRRGLSPKPKAQVMSVAERIKAAEHVQLAPHHSHFVQLS